MIISSTEFQQNVGQYLSLVESGEEVIVRKSKPYKFEYSIKPAKKTPQKPSKQVKSERMRILEEILKDPPLFDYEGSSVDFKNRMRE